MLVYDGSRKAGSQSVHAVSSRMARNPPRTLAAIAGTAHTNNTLRALPVRGSRGRLSQIRFLMVGQCRPPSSWCRTASETTNCHISPTTMSIQCTSPGWTDVWGMMAGATTQASSAIGAVTEAQMAKIFFSEYCLELAGASSCAGSDCVLVMPSASGRCLLITSPVGLEIASPSTPHG